MANAGRGLTEEKNAILIAELVEMKRANTVLDNRLQDTGDFIKRKDVELKAKEELKVNEEELKAKVEELNARDGRIAEFLEVNAPAFMQGFMNFEEQFERSYLNLDLDSLVPELEAAKPKEPVEGSGVD